MAIDRLDIPRKALYIEFGVDQSTWSRWEDYTKEQELPGHLLPRLLDMLDRDAREDFYALGEGKSGAPLCLRRAE